MPSQTSCIYYLLWLATLAIALTATIKPTRSQPIVPNGDTNTSVTQNGNELEITGGKQSDNGANLFHSFEQFGLNENQIANFVSHPNIENILGRINGGDPSIINGLIKLTGGNSNLFLMNPAGIVFGSGASLNVPGSFMATTADRIGLQESLGVRWFYASGEHNYADLIGTPNRFAFTMPEPGTILNAGNLSVGQGQDLTLLAGTILNFGTLSAGGHITVAAVPGESLVRISQTGHLLSLEVENYNWEGIRQNPNQGFPIEPRSLPQLLTGPGGTHATQVQQNEDGTLTLSGSGMEISAGDVVTTNEMTASTGIVLGRDRLIALASDVQTDGILHLEATETVQLQEMEAGAGSATIRSRGEIAIGESQLHIDGNLTLDAEETVQFHDSEAHPLQLDAGGNVEIRAANGIEIDLSNHSQSQWQTQGNLSFFSDGIIALNGVFHSGGHLSILDTSSNPTAFTSADGLTLNAQGDAIGGDYSGVSLKIETDGKIQTGDIEITASETSTTGESPSTELSLDSESNILVGDLTLEASETPLTARATREIQTGPIASQGGNISLTSGENLQAEAIASQGGNISLTSLNGAIATQSLDASSTSQTGGSISLTAPDSITPGNLTTKDNYIRLDGPIALTDSRTFRTLTADSPADTGGNLTITGTINGNFPLSLDTGAGDVVIEESIGNETPLARLSVRGNNISFHSRVVAEGEIAIAATGTANLRESLQTRGERVQISGGGSVSSADIRTPGGNIELDSQTSQITTGNLNSSSDSGDGGDVGVRAESGISSEAIATDSTIGKGGDVTLTSNRNDIEITSINAEGETQGGNVAIETTGAVRAIGSFTAKNGVEASISTAATEGGAIAIRHGETTFEIGDANQDGTLSNGTTAAITTGSGDTLTTGQTLSQPSIQLSAIPTEQPAQSEESDNAENDTASESEQTDNSDNSENDTASESEQTDNSDNSENDTASESEQTDNSDNSTPEQPTESEQTENSDNSTPE
ncbi:two-partner secretion domain-containing protein, partial [Phormidium sp. CCY1219]|uniref:two-partner secretion domain-containing protein n=1 Tax=Phormidium sp. CCY1219 TaxID=2886104 RepID=UPI002D1EBC34